MSIHIIPNPRKTLTITYHVDSPRVHITGPRAEAIALAEALRDILLELAIARRDDDHRTELIAQGALEGALSTVHEEVAGAPDDTGHRAVVTLPRRTV